MEHERVKKKKYDEITLLIQYQNPDIICVQETNIKNDNITKLDNYDGNNTMLDAMSNCNSKSPGPDDIPHCFIKNLPNNSLNQLLQIYNLIWEKCFFSDSWRKVIIIPIPKPDKNIFNSYNYRPIFLSTLSKLLEKMINKRLVWDIEVSKLLTNNQCGFRRNHSTLDDLVSLHTDICNAINTEQHLILIVPDREKAYDMVWRNRVLQIIQKWGITGKIFMFLKNFLINCSIQVKAHNYLSNV